MTDQSTHPINPEALHFVYLYVHPIPDPDLELNSLACLLLGGAIRAGLAREKIFIQGGPELNEGSIQGIFGVSQIQLALKVVKQVVFDLNLKDFTEIAYLDPRELIIRTYHNPFECSYISNWPSLAEFKPAPI